MDVHLQLTFFVNPEVKFEQASATIVSKYTDDTTNHFHKVIIMLLKMIMVSVV
jgi:hypothetical protein